MTADNAVILGQALGTVLGVGGSVFVVYVTAKIYGWVRRAL